VATKVLKKKNFLYFCQSLTLFIVWYRIAKYAKGKKIAKCAKHVLNSELVTSEKPVPKRVYALGQRTFIHVLFIC
jgi:hypothetical protein